MCPMSDWWSAPCAIPDASVEAAARARQEQLTKPPGSLGRLEDVAVRLAALQHTPEPSVERIWISIFAGDHGVAGEGVSAFPQSVTGDMLRNFAGGGAALRVLARAPGASPAVVGPAAGHRPEQVPGVRRALLAAA